MTDYLDSKGLVEAYKFIHRKIKGVMSGSSIRRHLDYLEEFIKDTKPTSVLDYGCGKGLQYHKHKIHEEFNFPMPTLYDPGVDEYDVRPKEPHDVVFCTDVMEHIHPDMCEATLIDVFRFAKHGVFFTISCQPARKHFPDGTNFHVNCKPEEWWFATIKRLKPSHLKVWLIFPSFKGIIKYDEENTK